MASGFLRLPGKGRTLLAESFTLLGEDQVVLVRRIGYRERYRRIELGDVEAFATAPTNSLQRTATALGTPVAVAAAFAALAGGGWSVFWSVVAGLFALALAFHLRRGPTCRVWLRTPLDWVEVPSLTRRKSADRALTMLAERLEKVQGELGVVEARERLAAAAPPLLEPDAEAVGAAVAASPARAGETAPRPGTGRWHDALAGATALHLAISVARWTWERQALDLVAALATLVLVVLGVVAVVRQAGTDLARPLRRWAVGSLVVLALGFVISAYVATFGAAFEAARSAGSPAPNLGAPFAQGALRSGLAAAAAVLDGGVLVTWLWARLASGNGEPRGAA